MKLINKQPEKKKIPDTARYRATLNLQAELFRVNTAVDELKVRGSIEDLDAAERVLWGALLVIDGLLGRK